MKCDCEGWKKNSDALTSIFFMAENHSCPYCGELFKFCPWCGKPLEKDEEEKQNSLIWAGGKS